MTFPTIPAGQYANQPIGEYDTFVDYLNAVAAAVDGNTEATSSLGAAAALDVGTSAGTVAAGDDARFSDARTPTAHTHAHSEVSGLGTMATQSASAYAALAAANVFTGEQKVQHGGLSLIVGADLSASTLTNSTTKYARIGTPHFTNTEEPMTLIMGVSDPTANEVRVGGGTGTMNAATLIRFLTAANTVTTNGAEVMRITADARVGIGSTSPAGLLHVLNTVSSIPALILRAAAGQTANIAEARNSSDTVLAAISAAGAATFNGVTSVGRVAAQASGGASGMNGASILMGADDGLTSLTNVTAKNGMLCVPHYTNAEEPVGLLRGSSDGTTNSIWIGGGPSNVNGATVIRFFTAATAATTTVAERLRLDTNGVTAYQTIIGAASTTSAATLRVPHGAAPSAPVDGDIWTTTAGAFIRVNGVTKQIQFV